MNFGSHDGKYRWSKDGGAKFPSGKKVKRIVLIVVAAVLLIIAGSTCWYTVDDKQQAVVTTFGKVTDVTPVPGSTSCSPSAFSRPTRWT